MRPQKTDLSLSWTGLILGCCILGGCLTSASEWARPVWWDNPRKHDDEFLFFKARGESPGGLEDARQQALRAIRTQIAEFIFTEVAVRKDGDGLQFAFESAAELRNVEVFDEAEARSGRDWIVWMLGRYPRSEYDRIKKRMELGVQLEDSWRTARAEKDWRVAEKLLLKILDQYDAAFRMSFKREEVKLELARVYLLARLPLKARYWLNDVLTSAIDPSFRKQADALIAKLPPPTARDAFEGHTVGICVFRSADGRFSYDPTLTQELDAWLIKDHVAAIQSSSGIVLTRIRFDADAAKDLATTFKPLGAHVVLAALLEIAPDQTDVRAPKGDGAPTGLNATLRYMILRVSDGIVLAADSTSGRATDSSYLLRVILAHANHLPKHAPLIAAKLAEKPR